ncbi:MAG TPA: ParB N-terminal domain-containing protein [Azospirillum sp.]
MTTTADGLVALPDVALIPLAEIEPAGGRPRRRVYEQELAALTASIQEFGLLQPIVVRRTARQRYELLAGERRLLAFRNLGHGRIPAIITAGLPAPPACPTRSSASSPPTAGTCRARCSPRSRG